MTDSGENGVSIDRLDSKGGYTPQNTQVICRRCNACKGDMTGAELMRLAKWVLKREASYAEQLPLLPEQ